ncbi:MAG: tetratricopeptide repeat protein, partial [Chloroflexota bacterium]
MISDQYILEEKIGQGGMGIVHRAIERITGDEVAFKHVILGADHPVSDEQTIAETLRSLHFALAHEFRILASLRHPHIISVLDYGFDHNRQPYFTMPYLHNAKTIIEAGINQSEKRRVQLVQQTLQALAYLHRRGIFHRDLKPGNVLVENGLTENGDTGSVRVLDFGLAVAREQVTTPAGSWAYLAPEILSEQPLTEAADLYAVGVLAYQLFAGNLPFDPTDPEFIDLLLDMPPDLTCLETGDGVSDNEGIASVIGRLLEKDPQDRYPSADAAIVAFSRAIGEPTPQESTAIRESFLQAAEFVGREQELAWLTEALVEARQNIGSSWLIGGESGVGKSRLLAELRIKALVSGFLVLQGQSVQDGRTPYRVWREPLRRLILSAEIDDLTAGVLKSLLPDIDRLLGRTIPTVPELSGQAGQQRLLGVIASIFRQQTTPILVILEDLQWAEESLVLLNHLNRMVPNLPVMIIGSYRDDERLTLGDDISTVPTEQHLKLERLSNTDIVNLSTSMLGDVGQQPEILSLLQRETEGNAFFLVEVVRALAEEAGRLGNIANINLPEHVFPQGIQNVVQRRLDRLPKDAQYLLTIAALAGRQLDLKILSAIVRTLSDAQKANTLSEQDLHCHSPPAYNPPANLDLEHFDFERWLAACVQVAVIEVQGESWQFAHDKFREGLSHPLSDEERKETHRLIAQTIEQIYPEDPDQAATLVFHWRQVGDTEQERTYAQLAGNHAQQQYANDEAIQYLSRAYELTPMDASSLTPTQYRANLMGGYTLLLARESIYDLLGEREAQQQDLVLLQTIADTLATQGFDERRAEVALREAGYALTIGDYSAAIQALQQAIALAQKIGDIQSEGAAHVLWGEVLTHQGDHATAQEQFTTALLLARTEANRQTPESTHPKSMHTELEADSLRFLGVVSIAQGNLDDAQIYAQQALPIYRALNNQQGESTVLNNLAIVFQAKGDYVNAESYWQKAREIYRNIGDRQGDSRTLANLGTLYMDLGLYMQVQDYFLQALHICQEINARFGEIILLLNLGLYHHYLGDDEQALRYGQNALHLAQESGNRHMEGHTLMLLGYALEGLDDGLQSRFSTR